AEGESATAPPPHALAAARSAPRNRSPDREDRLRVVLARSSFLVDGQPAGTRPPESLVLAAGAEIEVLPPFAGG
ncbi:MAG: MoaD/ThiS family protein, partial [Streptosporangiaceae bacterium]